MDTFETMREEAEVALQDLLAARPALVAAVDAATRQAFDAATQFENFCLRVARGTRHGTDKITPAVARLLDQARRARDAAAGELTRAKRLLQNQDWQIALRRDEIRQLELVAQSARRGAGSAL